MSREIKFRAWSGKEMHYDFFKLICHAPTKVKHESGDIDLPQTYTYSTDMVTAEEVMQYTGLKDKSGVEIYEGDVIREWDQIMPPVIWSNKHCSFQFLATGNEITCSMYLTQAFEVIGNIYENPELMEK